MADIGSMWNIHPRNSYIMGIVLNLTCRLFRLIGWSLRSFNPRGVIFSTYNFTIFQILLNSNRLLVGDYNLRNFNNWLRRLFWWCWLLLFWHSCLIIWFLRLRFCLLRNLNFALWIWFLSSLKITLFDVWAVLILKFWSKHSLAIWFRSCSFLRIFDCILSVSGVCHPFTVPHT